MQSSSAIPTLTTPSARTPTAAASAAAGAWTASASPAAARSSTSRGAPRAPPRPAAAHHNPCRRRALHRTTASCRPRAGASVQPRSRTCGDRAAPCLWTPETATTTLLHFFTNITTTTTNTALSLRPVETRAPASCQSLKLLRGAHSTLRSNFRNAAVRSRGRREPPPPRRPGGRRRRRRLRRRLLPAAAAGAGSHTRPVPSRHFGRPGLAGRWADVRPGGGRLSGRPVGTAAPRLCGAAFDKMLGGPARGDWCGLGAGGPTMPPRDGLPCSRVSPTRSPAACCLCSFGGAARLDPWARKWLCECRDCSAACLERMCAANPKTPRHAGLPCTHRFLLGRDVRDQSMDETGRAPRQRRTGSSTKHRHDRAGTRSARMRARPWLSGAWRLHLRPAKHGLGSCLGWGSPYPGKHCLGRGDVRIVQVTL